MKRIFKFSFNIDDSVVVNMPMDAEALTVQVQNDVPCMWALCDPSKPYGERVFKIFGTGHEVPDDVGPYVGTFQLRHLVFHMFAE